MLQHHIHITVTARSTLNTSDLTFSRATNQHNINGLRAIFISTFHKIDLKKQPYSDLSTPLFNHGHFNLHC